MAQYRNGYVVSNWTAEEDALIYSHLSEFPFPSDEVSRQLNRSLHSIKARAGRLREERRTPEPTGKGKNAPRPSYHRQPANKAGVTLKCLGCRAPFKSWDAKKNRLCPRCGSKSEDPTHTRHSAKRGA